MDEQVYSVSRENRKFPAMPLGKTLLNIHQRSWYERWGLQCNDWGEPRWLVVGL